jgi:hypothetical protein
MRKALIGILLAAGATMPAAAWARPNDGEVRIQNPDRAPQRAQRVEQRQEVRQQRQETRQQVRQDAGRPRIQQPQDAAQPPVAAQRRGGWSGQQGQGGQNGRGWNGRGGDQSGGSQSGRGWNRDRTPYTPGVEWQGDPNDPRMERYRRHYEELERRNQRDYQRDQRRDDRGGNWNRDNDRRGDWNGNRRWDRNGWRNDRRYDWQGWRNSNRYIYRNPGYYAPYRNYRYSRLSIGIVLDRLFWGQNYWIGDPWQYRLPDPGPGFAWVRYYDDVLLIDTYSGEVVDVIYDFFW